MDKETVESVVRRELAEQTIIGDQAWNLAIDDDLYRFGLTSLGTVHLLVALEEELSVALPDDLLTPETFRSIAAILGVLARPT